jgi:hypothetical protein
MSDTPNPQRPLFRQHLADLRRSGIEPATASAAGWFSTDDPDEINQLLSRGDLGAGLGPCLVLTYHAADGKLMTYKRLDGAEEPFVRLRPDRPRHDSGGRPIEFENPLNSTNRVFIPRGTDPDALADVRQPLAITAGETKALALAQAGFLAIAVGGTWGWTASPPDDADAPQPGQPRELIEDLRRLPVAGRRINFIMDSDAHADFRRHQPVGELAHALLGRGARVHDVVLPPLPGLQKVGADDYLVNVGAAGLTALVNQTPALRRRPQHPTGAAGGGAPQYVIEGGALHRVHTTAHGVIHTPLCNFSANIVGEIVLDDGVGQRVLFALEGTLAGGGTLPRVQVPADEFRPMGWLARYWGARPILLAGHGTADHTRAAIQTLSPAPPRTVVFTHVGWREVNGQRVYLHAGGAIGAGGAVGGVAVELPAQLGRFELPEPPTGEERVKATRASLRFLDLAPDRITFPLYALMLRAVLGDADFSGFVMGPTGVFKTQLAALSQQHWGAGLDARNVPASWESTVNALEGLAFAAKDSLLLVDDFVPHGSGADVQRQHREAGRLLRAQGNRSGRDRLWADGTLGPTRGPRGLILATGEDLPRGQSLRARLLVVEVEDGEVDKRKLTPCQEDAAQGQYAAMMSGFLSWLAPRYDDVRLRMKKAVTASRTGEDGGQSDGPDGGDGQHTRTPTMLTELRFALGVFLEFARSVGAATEEQCDQVLARGRAALEEVCRAQAKHIGAAEPAAEFLRLVAAALTSGRAHLAGKDGGAPADPAAWGWDTAGREPRAGGRRIGWVIGEAVYLDPASAYAAAQEVAKAHGCSLPVTERVLWTRLRERGKLASWDTKRQRNTVRKALGDRREREVLHLATRTLFPATPSSPPGPSDPSGCHDGQFQAEGRKRFNATHPSDGQPSQTSEGPSDRPLEAGLRPSRKPSIGRRPPQPDALSDGDSEGPSDGNNDTTTPGNVTYVADAAESDGPVGRRVGTDTPAAAADAPNLPKAEVVDEVEVETVGDEAGI